MPLERSVTAHYTEVRALALSGEGNMHNEVLLTIEMDEELRERFLIVAASRQLTAAQIISEFMRSYIADSEAPNATTAETIRKSRKGEDIFHAASPSELFDQLDI